MNGLRDTAIAVCAVMIVCSMVSILLPGEKFERVMKTVLAAVMLVTIVSGIVAIDFSFVPDAFDTHKGYEQSEFSQNVVSYAEKVVENTAREMLTLHFENLGIECTNISFEINTCQSGSISIDRVMLVISDAQMHSRARSAVKEILGQNTEVSIVRE